MKELFSYTVDIEKEVDKIETKEENGTTITVTQKVKEKTPVKIIIKQPSRRNLEDAELQFSIEMSNCIKKGILTKGMLTKKYSDTGGYISQDDAVELTRLYVFIVQRQEEYSRLITKNERDSVKEAQVIEEIVSAKQRMVELETSYSNLFNNTADNIAQNNVIRWFCLNMSHIQVKDGAIEPMFKGETLEEKISSMHKMDEDEDPVYVKAYRKLATFVSFWFFSKNSKREDFDKLNDDIESGKFDKQ